MSLTNIPMEHLVRVYQLLVREYGEPKNDPDYDPLGGLIGTILSQHTSDANSGRAYKQLVSAFPTWEDVRDAPPDKIVEAIKCGGLANIKSVRIQDVLCTLTNLQREQRASINLAEFLYDELSRRSTEDAWCYLRELPGVGPKTAACVLLFNLDRPSFPIDTHVYRVSKRLGLLCTKVSAEQAHDIFDEIVPPEWVYPLHINLIQHGRRICHAQHPKCNQCLLYSACAYVGSVYCHETTCTG